MPPQKSSRCLYADVTQICIPHYAVTHMFTPVSGFLCCRAIVHYIKSFLFPRSVSIRRGHERVSVKERLKERRIRQKLNCQMIIVGTLCGVLCREINREEAFFPFGPVHLAVIRGCVSQHAPFRDSSSLIWLMALH